MSSSHTIEQQSGLVKRQVAAGLRPVNCCPQEWRDIPSSPYDVKILSGIGRRSITCYVVTHGQDSSNHEKQIIE